jgi:branched-chain amino acid aminotransferase
MYYNQHTIIYHNGEFVKAVDANANVYDTSLHYGYAVFEGIRSYNTRNGVKIFKAEEHFQRMQFSANAVGIPYPYKNDELIEISYEVLKRNNMADAYLRPIITCPPNMSLTGGTSSQLTIAAWEWPALLGEKLVRLKTSSYRRINASSFIVEAKVSGHYVNSILASKEARASGYDEALLLDINGFVAEGPGANFFYEKNDIFFTPQRGSILPGITRATVIEICKSLGIEVVEKQITPEEVYNADSAFYCGTAAEVIGIESLDNKKFSKNWSETIGAVIQEAYKNLVLQKQIKPAEQVA